MTTKPALIGFTGARNSGKVAYARECRDRMDGSRIVHLPSPTAEVMSKFGVNDFRIFEHDLRFCLTFQSNMLSTYIKHRTDIFNEIAEQEEDDRPIAVISDRTPLDFMGYLFANIMRSQDPANDQPDFIKKIATFITACRNEYILFDAVVHCPADISFAQDAANDHYDTKFEYAVEVGIGYYKDRWLTSAHKISLHDIQGQEARRDAVFDLLDKTVAERNIKGKRVEGTTLIGIVPVNDGTTTLEMPA